MTVVPLPRPTFYAPLLDYAGAVIFRAQRTHTLGAGDHATVISGGNATQGLGVVAVVANEMRFWGRGGQQ